MKGRRYYYSGADAVPPPRPVLANKQATITGQATGLIELAAKPVKWGVNSAGGLIKWLGGTVQALGNKL